MKVCFPARLPWALIVLPIVFVAHGPAAAVPPRLFVPRFDAGRPVPDLCGDALDENGDGVDPVCPGGDADFDGFAATGDCDDHNRYVYPGVSVLCTVAGEPGTRTCGIGGTWTVCSAAPLCEAKAKGRCFYIDPTHGSDANPGSFAYPWRTLANVRTYYCPSPKPAWCNSDTPPAGWVHLQAGDVIYLFSGLYASIYDYGGQPRAFFLRNVQGTVAAPITVRAYPGEDPVFNARLPVSFGEGMSRALALIYVLQSRHLVFDGLTLRDSYGTAFRAAEVSGLELSRLWVRDAAGVTDGNLSGVEFTDVQDAIIHHCLMHDNYEHKVRLPGQPPQPTGRDATFFGGGSLRILYNVIFQSPALAGATSSDCVMYKHKSTVAGAVFEVGHNTFLRCFSSWLSSSSPSSWVHHNRVVNSDPLTFADMGGPAQVADQVVEFNTISGGPGLEVRPTVGWGLPLGPITLRDNIVHEFTPYDSSEHSIIMLGHYAGDDLYRAMVDGGLLHFTHNAYSNSAGGLRFDLFAANDTAQGFGHLGAYYNFADWQTLGYDGSSRNDDPQLDDNLLPTRPGFAGMGWLPAAVPPPTATTTISPTSARTRTTTASPGRPTSISTPTPTPSGTETPTVSAAPGLPEPICPNGSDPRSDILWCADFEHYDDPSCITGEEPPCLNANNMAGKGGKTFRIQGGDAAVGNGAIVGTGDPGGTGSGWVYPPQFGTRSLSANLRFYVKFKDGYMQPALIRGNHGPGLKSTGGVGENCYQDVVLDWYYSYPAFILEGTCVPSYGIDTNINKFPLKNDRWYLIEIHSTMNTVTTGSGPHDGNGVVIVWIDGHKVLEYNDLNIRGNSHAMFDYVWAARSYYGLGFPPWPQKLLYDNFVYSSTGTYIGPAAGENPRGTPDGLSPYVNIEAYNGFVGHKLGDDCSKATGALDYTVLAHPWRDGAYQLQSGLTHGGYIDRCTTDPDKALAVTLTQTNSGGGVFYELLDRSVPMYAIHAWIYLPSSNDYLTVPALLGLAEYGDDPQVPGGSLWGQYVALAVSHDRWSIVQRNSGTPVVAAEASPVAFDRWHEVEWTVRDNGTASLMVDRAAMISDVPLPGSSAWIWASSDPRRGRAILGVIDFTGQPPFQLFVDDSDIGTASYWSCAGWSATSCPFAVPATTPTSVPATSTPSPTITPTATATCGPSCGIGGTITHFAASETLPGVSVRLEGPASISLTGDTNGAYNAFPLATGRWAVDPSMQGGINGAVTPLDAVFILQTVVGKRSLDAWQQLACDVTGNGVCGTTDAVHILQFVVAKRNHFRTAQKCASDWLFVPQPGPAANQTIVSPAITADSCQHGQIILDPLAQPSLGQDFSAVLLGDVNGSWHPLP